MIRIILLVPFDNPLVPNDGTTTILPEIKDYSKLVDIFKSMVGDSRCL